MARKTNKRSLFEGLLAGSKSWFVTLEGHNPQYFVGLCSVLRWLESNGAQLCDITWQGANQ